MPLQSTYQPHLRKLTRMNKTDIESTLTADFSPDVLHVIDDSANHRGHKGTLILKTPILISPLSARYLQACD